MKNKEYKFFEKILDNDLESLNDYINLQYEILKENNWGSTVSKIHPYDPGFHWKTWNVFDFKDSQIKNIFNGIKELMIDACNYYEIDFNKQEYHVHGWFNYWSGKNEINVDPKELNYHDHGDFPTAFHGFYCLNAEPSITYYKISNKIFENYNKNNRMIIGKNGAPHAVGSWPYDTPRITIAYNVVPKRHLHPDIDKWIPLV
jgi:hypothetical protein